MDLRLDEVNGIKVLRIQGDITEDRDSLVVTFTDMLSTPHARIVLDLTRAKYLNSAALGDLVRMVGQANVQEARVILAGAPPFIAGLFAATRLDRFFEQAPSLEDALQRLSTPQPVQPV
ncbi:MAG TPA: STAS domain-containing protein [Phycisphaerae bacterium]|nr:STAS domain-containing protein [Phycisphaerae bacterium]